MPTKPTAKDNLKTLARFGKKWVMAPMDTAEELERLSRSRSSPSSAIPTNEQVKKDMAKLEEVARRNQLRRRKMKRG